MTFTDKVYGKVEITDTLVLEIINSSIFQRLKGVNQAGYSKPHLGVAHFSRFDHCVGVYLLLKRYQVPFEEQLAGLIHDVSHSVFSHSIDYVLAEGSQKDQSHQDNIHKDYVLKSALEKIFTKSKVDLNYILEDKNFPLKETELPDLCADRIDYSLREGLVYKKTTKKEVNNFLKNLVVINNCWIFSSLDIGKRYAHMFLDLSGNHWASFDSAVMFRTTGDYLQYALSKKYINLNDLYTTDQKVLDKIKTHLKTDEELKRLWLRMNRKVEVKNNPKNFDSQVYCKSRVVDPFCFYKNSVVRISEVDKSWAKTLKEESQPKEYFLKFLD